MVGIACDYSGLSGNERLLVLNIFNASYSMPYAFSLFFRVDRNKYQIHIPLPPKIDPTVTMMQVIYWVQTSGLEIATDTVANATNIFSLATKNSSLVAKVATRFLYDLDLN